MPSRAPYFWGLILLQLLSGCPDKNPDQKEKDPKAKEKSSPPKRIVTLTPSATEVVAAVGGLDRIVAVDRFSDSPPQVRDLPEVGDFLTPDLEAIVRLEPDLVILDADQDKARAALGRAGLRTLGLRMHTLDDVREGLEQVGEALGTEAEAKKATGALDRAVREVSARAAARSKKPRVLLVVDREIGGLGNLVAAGPGSFLDDLLEIVGAKNAIADASVRYPRLSAEEILEARPEVILDAVHTDDQDKATADWSALDIPAVDAERVHILGDQVFLSPGPRVGEALRRMEALVFSGAKGL